MRTVAVIQARMGSTRLPGKVLEMIGHRPLVLWTVAAAAASEGVDGVVVATSTDPADDPLAALMQATGVPTHRGPVHDVLTRVWEAAAPLGPEFVVRATADNPFMDPTVVARQLRLCIDEGFDYVGTGGWPIGIAAEVARARALAEAYAEAREPAEREHVMPFLYTRPVRYRIGSAPPELPVPDARFTVDTDADLAFAREVAARLGPVRTCTLGQLGVILEAEPELARINRDVRQKGWQEVEQRWNP
jgi:spore coat polysaccharide biosynthesis protein SpsF (cytidylyltransferase family)